MKTPLNEKPINKLWGVLSRDKNGNEGILGIDGPFGVVPALTGSERVLERFKEIAREEIADGFEIVVAEFIRGETKPL